MVITAINVHALHTMSHAGVCKHTQDFKSSYSTAVRKYSTAQLKVDTRMHVSCEYVLETFVSFKLLAICCKHMNVP